MTIAPHLGFARKYRPQNISEVIGQEAVAVTLRNSLAAGKPAHAYLFFGPRGVGKTTTARILAKALNCEKGISADPCGQCASCREIAKSASVDVLELDAATHTQVDRIREMIIETVSLSPSRDRYKIFIIDEVHMLSTASFNALLKTLEEPPAHVVFILATTDFSKIPATIVSRCQRFRFRPVPVDVITQHLAGVAKIEQIAADDGALQLLSEAAAGALRDAVSLLEQAHIHAGGRVTVETVRDLLGTLPEELLRGFARTLLARDAAALSKQLEKVWEEGYDPAQLLRDLRERMRLAYLYRLGVVATLGPEWKALADPHSPETFSFFLQRLNKALENLRLADSPRLALEMSLYGVIQATHDFREWISRLEALEQRLDSGLRRNDDAGKLYAEKLTNASPLRQMGEGNETISGAKAAPAQVWDAVLKQLEENKPGLASDLRSAQLQVSEGAPWRLLFRRAFDAERARGRQKELEAELSALSGRAIQLSLEVASPETAGEDASKPEMEAESAAAADPAVQKVLQVFPGKVRVSKR